MATRNNQPDNTLREMRVVDTMGVKGMKDFMTHARARIDLFQAMFPDEETQRYIWSGPDDVDPEKKIMQ
jgi:hypothetical protein